MRSDVDAVRACAGAMAEAVKSKASWMMAFMDEAVTEEISSLRWLSPCTPLAHSLLHKPTQFIAQLPRARMHRRSQAAA